MGGDPAGRAADRALALQTAGGTAARPGLAKDRRALRRPRDRQAGHGLFPPVNRRAPLHLRMTRRGEARALPIGGAFTPIRGAALLWLFAVLLPDASYAKDYSLNSRDIGCAEVAPGRLRQICDAVSASLTWQWMGHAVIAPGYKPSFKGIRNVYCELKIGKDDVKILQILRQYDPKRKWLPDWRLESGADMLLQIVANLDGTGDEPENSIFSPKNSSYILKDGCS